MDIDPDLGPEASAGMQDFLRLFYTAMKNIADEDAEEIWMTRQVETEDRNETFSVTIRRKMLEIPAGVCDHDVTDADPD